MQYIYIIDPEVTEPISFSLSTNDFVGKSNDGKYRLLSNYEGNLCLGVASSYDSEKDNFERENFFAVVYDASNPD